MMDIKESIKELIKQSTKLLKKLENDEDTDECSTDIDMFEKIIEDSKSISSRLKLKRSKSQLNGNRSSGDDSRSSSIIKLVPIEKLMEKSATKVLDKTCIELSDSDNEVLVQSSVPKSNDRTNNTTKASILNSVFSFSRESSSKNHTNKTKRSTTTRCCKVGLKRVDLNRLAASNGLDYLPTVNEIPTKKSSKTVRFFIISYQTRFLI